MAPVPRSVAGGSGMATALLQPLSLLLLTAVVAVIATVVTAVVAVIVVAAARHFAAAPQDGADRRGPPFDSGRRHSEAIGRDR